MTTAGRIGALLELTWDRVDLDHRMIKLATNDTGPRKGRARVPINDRLMAALKPASAAALSRYVIEWGGRKVGSIKTGFNAAVARSGIEHCTPHDLRRTAGWLMAEAGVPMEEIAQYLGHRNPAAARGTYAKLSPDHLRKAAGALELGSGLRSSEPKCIPRFHQQVIDSMVTPAGFEPATCPLGGGCSIQLSHGAIRPF